MKAAAMFAAAYGFPPSLCTSEESLGLFQNIRLAMAMRSAQFARGVAVCFSAEANADLMKDCGADFKDIAKMKIEAMRRKGGMG